jgi:hypothetical protein
MSPERFIGSSLYVGTKYSFDRLSLSTKPGASGELASSSFLPSASNFFVDFFALLCYLSAIGALLSKRD